MDTVFVEAARAWPKNLKGIPQLELFPMFSLNFYGLNAKTIDLICFLILPEPHAESQ